MQTWRVSRSHLNKIKCFREMQSVPNVYAEQHLAEANIKKSLAKYTKIVKVI